MQEKVAAVGFDWRDAAGAKRKVDEEIAETEREAVDGTPVWSSSGPSGPTSS
jgi:uncharacterized protein YabN with tetrapyrrole methylase and pyrophosphatase domain